MKHTAQLYLEPEQERELAPELRAAYLSGCTLLATIVRDTRGVRLDIGRMDRPLWLRLRKVLDAEAQPKKL